MQQGDRCLDGCDVRKAGEEFRGLGVVEALASFVVARMRKTCRAVSSIFFQTLTKTTNSLDLGRPGADS